MKVNGLLKELVTAIEEDSLAKREAELKKDRASKYVDHVKKCEPHIEKLRQMSVDTEHFKERLERERLFNVDVQKLRYFALRASVVFQALNSGHTFNNFNAIYATLLSDAACFCPSGMAENYLASWAGRLAASSPGIVELDDLLKKEVTR